MIYENAVKLLTSNSKFYINLGLERIKEVLNRLNNPETRFKIIHVAGTNGKGSVCALTAEILKSAGYKTGLYTSPHLVEYTERIKINGNDISKEDFAKYTEQICDISEDIDLTEFEILTAAALKYFADNKIEIAVLETGLGGRYDATNAIRSKILSVITSISLDHTDKLGDTVEKTAFEKAGIIKENTPVIISDNNRGYETVKKVAETKQSKVIVPSEKIKTFYENGLNYIKTENKKYEFSLYGEYQSENVSLVSETIKYLNKTGFKIPETAVIDGLKNVKWGARFEYIKDKDLIIDGAHNPDAAKKLKKSLDKYFPGKKRIYIYATLNTKDYKSIANILFDEADTVYYYEFKHKNAVSFEEYKRNVPQLKNLQKFTPDMLENILKLDGLKIVTGSLYMTGDLYPRLI